MSSLDTVIHQPVRLQIMAALSALPAGEQLDFTHLRGLLKLTDGNLGAHLQKLEAAGYVTIEKAFVNKKPRSSVFLTDPGRAAFQAHVAALQQILQTAPSDENA